jgi:hypothetical protein
MRPFAVFLLAIEILLGLGFSCSSPPREPQMSGPLGVVRFPAPWVKLRGDKWVGVNDNIQYVIRRTSKGPAGGELIFAVKQGFDGSLFGKEVYDFPVNNPDYDYYSDDRFAVSLDGRFSVRKATAGEWDVAEKPLHSYHFIKSFENPHVTGEAVKYNDRLYRKSGEFWGTEVALVSPRATRIAVFSYTSREKPPKPLIPGFGNTEPGHGEVFLDVYDISSGEKVIAAHAPYGGTYGGHAPSMLFGSSLWVDDRYFVMPLEPSHEFCFLGILPVK